MKPCILKVIVTILLLLCYDTRYLLLHSIDSKIHMRSTIHLNSERADTMLSSFGKKTVSTVLISMLLLPGSALANTTVNMNMNNNPLLLARITDTETAKILTQSAEVTIGGKTVTVQYALVPKNANLTADLSIAQNALGQTDDLNNLASQGGSLAAINGCLFQSYDATKPMDPYGTLIKDGKLIHKGDLSAVVGLTKDNTVKIGIMQPVINLTLGSASIKADNYNHTPAQDGSAVSIFTRARGTKVGFNYGTNLLVSEGQIVQVLTNSNATIPMGGYVINLTGEAAEKYQAQAAKGTKVSYSISYVNENGVKSDWSAIETAIGAGPILLKDGSTAINLAKENFTDISSADMSFARSAIGINESGNLLLVAGVNCNLAQMADVMSQLGAVDAICLGSGSSSGLYVNEQYLVKPNRSVSNALVFRLDN